MAPHADESQAGQNGRESGQGNGHAERNSPKDGEYIQFECLPPGGPLNRWSHFMTKGHDFPGAQVRITPSVRGVILSAPEPMHGAGACSDVSGCGCDHLF
jgi:hypothetical protein